MWLLALFLLTLKLVGCSNFNETIKDKVHNELKDIELGVRSHGFIIYNAQTDEQDQVDTRLWGGVNIGKKAARLGEHLRDIANDVLGVTTLQGVFDSLSYTVQKTDLEAEVELIGNAISEKLNQYKLVLLSNRELIQNVYQSRLMSRVNNSLSCCPLHQSTSSLGISNQSHNASWNTVCDVLPVDVDMNTFNPGRNLSQKFSENIQHYPALKWQYFMSNEGVHNEFPANRIDRIMDMECWRAQAYMHRDVFVKMLSPKPKNVAIVIDVSTVLSREQLVAAKTLAKQAIFSLSATDKVMVLKLSENVKVLHGMCSESTWVPVTLSNKDLLARSIDSLARSNALANHTLGLEYVFSAIGVGDPTMVIYISRGLMNSITEAKQVMTVVAEGNSRHSGRVTIDTFGLIDDGKSILYEKAFLKDIATQNFSKFGISYDGPPVSEGKMRVVCCPSHAASALNDLFTSRLTTPPPIVTDVKLSEASKDFTDNSVVVSLSAPCFSSNQTLFGVVGLDLVLEDLFEDVLDVNSEERLAFVINHEGYLIIHPKLKNSIAIDATRMLELHWTDMENCPGTLALSDQIRSTKHGSQELLIDASNSTCAITPKQERVKYVYSWVHVEKTPYIVVLRIVKSRLPSREIYPLNADKDDMVYHRLDLGLLSPDKTCLHFHQLASFSTSALFLSTHAFTQPYQHVNQPETKSMVQSYVTYLTDSSSQVLTPGIKSGVKQDCIALSKINNHWLTRSVTSQYNDFVVRSYAATSSGVYRMFPAALTSKTYQPHLTEWYRQSYRRPGKIIISRPYIDTAGAGFIVTMSHSIYEGRSATLHTSHDPVDAVVAADMSSSYIHRLLLETIPVCDEALDLRCFLMDENGYIISHPLFKEHEFRKSHERQHLTHMEPVIAHDILGHKSLVTKKLCNSFSDKTVQRFYQFNTSLADTLTNLKTGEQCLRYQMVLIPGTNTFIVMVNETCNIKLAAFCPCSITDRLCLNCQRMEQAECECPCECPLAMDSCTGFVSHNDLVNPSCDVISDNNILFKLPSAISEKVAQCVEPSCDKYSSKLSCMGVVGCSWCLTQQDGHTPLARGYCAAQQLCFGGVLGARTPYNDQIRSQFPKDQQSHRTLVKSSLIGPVTCAVLGTFVFIAIAIYCYMHKSSRESNDSGNVNICNPETNGYVYHELPTLPGPSNPPQLPAQNYAAEMELPTHISPYRINVNYRPPRPVVTTTESSDHGYSSMTVHDEAETSSLSCMESLKSVRTKYNAPNVKILPPSRSSRRNTSSVKDTQRQKLLSVEEPVASCSRTDGERETERVELLNLS